jgi:(p)ppGpp synthase/HD superfamily hydrolase
MKTSEDGPAEDPTLAGVVAAAEESLPRDADALNRARAFAEPLIAHETLASGENTWVHADAVAAILGRMGGSEFCSTRDRAAIPYGRPTLEQASPDQAANRFGH